MDNKDLTNVLFACDFEVTDQSLLMQDQTYHEAAPQSIIAIHRVLKLMEPFLK